ncbi:MAG TPA: NADH:ubiquinone reductase (Na(+)-transporting) subunit C [Prolixibacteraceae bacterium]|jgi:Na+-transporting NADH:ubiquinone oxidoreductase subunit C|nr:NADH:ubiquinone reductase (Na(+)-transporting) subunit C [Prolixibacteraceae bacterium]HPJ79279.1 NADH:ubiquinone reductase (Na(+)-transporting) subunit C [Prolixibacteraceae bacterium]HRV88544.1 NADH:ubiquinone reductase (Na(+)-transporting) subunit C [Prolixibacteraceae bacterium]
MNKNGNSYTFIYASVMVVVVAALLSAAAISLKPKQVKNAEIEKKQNILASVHIEATATDAESLYEQNIQKAYVVNAAGEEVAGDAFTVDLKKERSKPLEQRILPVFECQTPEGLKYILPLRGTGLWGPIWGYLALNEDLNTIYGVNFDHQGETPGLGAEINTPAFQEPFRGKTIFDAAGKLVAIIVAKSNETAPAEHKVDAISGGTITSKGLQQMLLDDLTSYEKFITRKKSAL